MTQGTGTPATILFAGSGVLFDLSSIARSVSGGLAERAEALVRDWRRELTVRVLGAQPGDAAESDYWGIVSAALDRAMHGLGIDDVAIRARLMQKFLNVDPFPDAAPALRTLRSAGRRIGVLTNMTMTMVVSALKHGGLSRLVDVPLSTEHSGTMKPMCEAYTHAAERLRIAPSDLCFVTSNVWDAEGAIRASLRVMLLDREGSNRPAPETATHLASLAELPTALGT
ncbi:MAG TPA: HAD-IA family hydrolase [Alphaproteobacteria bacterium]|jgi:2-haloacid dehalogenase